MAIIFNVRDALGNKNMVDKTLQAPIFHQAVDHVSLVLNNQKENKRLEQ